MRQAQELFNKTNRLYMDKLKESINSGISPSIIVRDLVDISNISGNIYKSLVIITKRSNQLARELKVELNQKLEEFASSTDSLEEIHENREQIEISKYYERMPNPVVLAIEEFIEGGTYFRDPELASEEEVSNETSEEK